MQTNRGKKCTKKFDSHDWRGAGIFTFCRNCKIFLLDFNRKQLHKSAPKQEVEGGIDG